MTTEIRERLRVFCDRIGQPDGLEGMPEAWFDGQGNMARIIDGLGGTGMLPCRDPDCGAAIFFVKSKKTGRPMPFNCEDLEPHWASCPGAQKFRKKRA